jgi:hypothetical protein
METQDIVGLEGMKLCFYDTLIITSLRILVSLSLTMTP